MAKIICLFLFSVNPDEEPGAAANGLISPGEFSKRVKRLEIVYIPTALPPTKLFSYKSLICHLMCGELISGK